MKQGYQPTEHIENPIPPKGRPAYMPRKLKTEQEVREAIKEFDEMKFVIKSDEPIYWCGQPVEEVMSLSTVAVIIGKALGVVE